MEPLRKPVLLLIKKKEYKAIMLRYIRDGGDKYERYDFTLLADDDLEKFSLTHLYDEVADRIRASVVKPLVIPIHDRGAVVHAALAREFPHIEAPSLLSELIAFHKGETHKVVPTQYAIPTLPLTAEAIVHQKDLMETGLMNFPLFVKPSMGNSSVLAKKVDNAKELKEFLNRGTPLVSKLSPGIEEFVAKFVTDSSMHTSVRNVWILQQFVGCNGGNGSLCCVDGMVYNGEVTLWDILELEFWAKAPTAIKCESSPAALEPIQERNVLEAYQQIVTELISRGFDKQFVDMEAFVMNNGKVYIVEVNARGARMNWKSYRILNKENGDGLWALVSIAEGVSPQEPVRDPHLHGCIAYITVYGEGLAKEFIDFEKARKMEEFDLTCSEETNISCIGEWGYALGYCYTFGQSREVATEKARQLIDQVVTAKEACIWLTD